MVSTGRDPIWSAQCREGKLLASVPKIILHRTDPVDPIRRYRLSPTNGLPRQVEGADLQVLNLGGLPAASGKHGAPKGDQLGVAVDPKGVTQDACRWPRLETLDQRSARTDELADRVFDVVVDQLDLRSAVAPKHPSHQSANLLEPTENEIALHRAKVISIG